MTISETIAHLRGSIPAVLPSLLMCDFGQLANEVRRIEAAGVPGLHLDVMDGHFVPNLSYGLPLVEAFRRMTTLPLDVHLMISNPAQYIERYREAGADSMTIHVEAVHDPRPLLREIRAIGAMAGLALNPDTPVSAVRPYLKDCDLVLVMSVNPGFGGQKFDRRALDKLAELRSLAGDELLLEIDGGVNDATIADCCAAGAQLLVVGSAIFGTSDYLASTRRLVELASSKTTRSPQRTC
ncbi:MAG: ribulose-phosphate 3-epimerase [Planctomycetes bacterium]|nr:ribulose-phosphate 3-epimerase [Planctomycetota bacterium]